MIYHLDHRIYFPDPTHAEPDGLLAIGGDLSVERLQLAYKNGIFPWFNEDDPILWYSPHERCVIFPEKVAVSTSMKKFMNTTTFRVTRSKAFSEVVMNCGRIKRPGQEGTWITDSMQTAYLAMSKKGLAESVEVWDGEELVGGLYGVVSGHVFCGESMFSKASNASKLALITQCKSGNYQLIDCQLPNEHLMRMGAEMISRDQYMDFL